MYQYNYASGRPHMYDMKSRIQKANRIIKTLADYYGTKSLSRLSVLDVGSSTGIIDNVLASKFSKIIGTDIDIAAVSFANKHFKKKNLSFKVENAMNLSFPDNSFDIVICTQVYEHVPNAKKLFDEIYRVLKPNGVCYFAALNSLWPIEPHYNLPFLSWLPKKLANSYLRLTGKGNLYYENPESYWNLKILTAKFERAEYTSKILRDPIRFGYDDVIPNRSIMSALAYLLSPVAKYLSPTFFWILIKKI